MRVLRKCTTDGKPPREGYESARAPAPIDPTSGQHEAYWVLCEEERKKGFVRPVRDSYKHVGVRPKYPLRDLTDDEKGRYAQYDYAAFEEYPKSESPVTGMFWTKERLARGCGAVTTMGRALAETYARDPKFYGSTFCCNCRNHFSVGEDGEFIWTDDGTRVGT